jgi:glycosyltransferase involved in cell wall biosynthesis
LSWSFIEAMACGCVVVGSSTPPVLDLLRDGENGLAVEFFACKRIASRIEEALDRGDELRELRTAARATAVSGFDLKRVLLPRWTSLFDDLIDARPPQAQVAPPAPRPVRAPH